MKLQKLAGATSEIWQIFCQDSSSTTGAGLTGLLFNTASLTAYYHRDTDTTATAISLVTMTVGTFTSSGFKEIDATNMPGWYQLCPPNAAVASGAKSCAIHLKGATNLAPLAIEVQLTAVNPDSATAFVTSVATVTTVTNQLTAAQIATGVWQDSTSGDFTAASSIGKSLYTAGVVPGGANGLFIAGTNAATTITTSLTTTFTGNLTGSVGSVTGLTASNLDATISSRMATYTQPTGFLAATFPTGTVANTTNITAGTITTTTNLTNAPTAGDFTATMKTSLSAATPALSSAGVQAIWDALTSNLTTSGSIGKVLAALPGSIWDVVLSGHTTSGTTGAALNAAGSSGDPWATALPGAYGAGTAGNIVGTNLNATVSSRSTYSGGAVASVTGSVGSVVGLTASNLDAAVSTRAVPGDAMALTSAERNATADAWLNRDMSVGTDSGSPTVRTPRQALRFNRNKWSIAGGTLTVLKEDDTTASVDRRPSRKPRAILSRRLIRSNAHLPNYRGTPALEKVSRDYLSAMKFYGWAIEWMESGRLD